MLPLAFNLHLAIIGLEKQFLVFLRVAVLHRFYCMSAYPFMVFQEELDICKHENRYPCLNVV